MPAISNRFGKVQKHIAKKKGRGTALHENSRDQRRLESASARDDKLNRLAAVREKQNKTYILRTKSFQSYTVEHTLPCTLSEIQRMIEDYLGREDEELSKLQAERRSGRPPSTRETLLKQIQATERGEYASGFWVPDLEDMANLEKLKSWNGQWASLATLKFIRVTKEGERKESIFPPKGQS
ncbi:translation machinery-associated protein 16 [Dendryphion nanum]|uniref:Translation machinery-associated protein 16 n=1 Tax=Dendryphion nanum TaxID=256645 RepID=A0A9P9EJD0_9PLEO|nr:translation machinery-associated protein 16 [Dendryphion nanum]